MKRFIFVIMLLIVAPALGAISPSVDTQTTYKSGYNWTGDVKDTLLDWAQAIEDTVDGTTGFVAPLYIIPQSAATGAVEGYIYYDSDDDNLYVYANGSYVDLTAGTGSPPGADTQMAYNNNGSWGAIATIVWDDTNLEFANDQSAAFGTEADWTVNFDDSVDDQLIWLTAATAATATTDPLYEIIVGASPTADQQVFGIAKGTQASNTALLTVDEDGDVAIAGGLTVAGVFSADITLSSGETITNTTNTEINFAQNGGEDFIFDMDSGANALGFKSGTGIDEIAFGTVDDLTGIGSIEFDAAAAAITLPTDGAAQDLLIQITGATNSGIVIQSTGTAADALVLTTDAGGIDITVAGAASGEDIDITTDSSVNIIPSEAAVDALVLNASGGGIDIDAVDDIDIQITSGGAGEDILITQVGGNDSSITLTAAGTGTDAIGLQATAGGLDVDVVDDLILTLASTAGADDFRLIQTGAQDASISLEAAGTGADAIRLQASAGGLDVDCVDDLILTVASTAGADDFRLIQTGAQDASISLEAAGTGADAIRLQASAGGLDIDAVDDIAITVASTAGADDLVIQQTGAQNASIHVLAAGTGTDAITLVASAGGIDITSTNAGAGDIDITANTSRVIVTATEDAAEAIYLHANAGTSEAIKVHADQGSGLASIELDSDAGGVTVNAAAAAGKGVFTLNSIFCIGAAGTLADNATPDVSGGSYWETGAATTYTDFDVDTGTVGEGTIIVIKSLHAAVFDVTASELEGGTTDLTTASGDMTAWIYDGANKWKLFFFMDMSDDLS